MRNIIIIWLLYLLILLPQSVPAEPIVLDYVPSYAWYHGCSPTASASIVGYWDLHGYDNLFNASGWEEVRLTENVRDQISSPEHNAKYDPNPDNPNLPAPPYTSIADFMHTSEGGLGMGWTYVSNIPYGISGYSTYKGYNFAAAYFSVTWENYIAEIAAGNPVLINVDSSGDGVIDHSMVGIGYEDRGANGLWYASYTTWHESETIDWYQFRGTSSNYSFGIYSMAYVHPLSVIPEPPGPIPEPQPNPVPEPSLMVLLGISMMSIVGLRRWWKD